MIDQVNRTGGIRYQGTPITDDSFDSSSVNANFEAVKDVLEPLGGGIRSLETLAVLLGGLYVEGTLSQAEDLAFSHDFGEIPRLVVLGVDLGGLGGLVLGTPFGASGSNSQPWTETDIYLRATLDGDYAAIIL